MALNDWVPPFWTEAVAGVTVIEVRTGGGGGDVEATTAKFCVCHCANNPQKIRHEPVTWLLPQTTPSFTGSGLAPA